MRELSVACCEKLLPKGKSQLRLFTLLLRQNQQLFIGLFFAPGKAQTNKGSFTPRGIRLIASSEWQTPLLARFYLNISYGRFYVNFRPRGEAVNRTSLKRFNVKRKRLMVSGFSESGKIPGIRLISQLPISLQC